MHGLERYELVRRSALAEGMSEREASREFGVNRRKVKKMLAHPVHSWVSAEKAQIKAEVWRLPRKDRGDS